MYRPVKRGFRGPDLDGLGQGISAEASYDINQSHSKRQRYFIPGAQLSPGNEPQDTTSPAASGFSNPQSEFLQPVCAIWHGNDRLSFELHPSILEQSLPYIGPGLFIVPSAQFVPVSNPESSDLQFSTEHSDVQSEIASSHLSGYVTSDPPISNYLPLGEATNNSLSDDYESLRIDCPYCRNSFRLPDVCNCSVTYTDWDDPSHYRLPDADQDHWAAPSLQSYVHSPISPPSQQSSPGRAQEHSPKSLSRIQAPRRLYRRILPLRREREYTDFQLPLQNVKPSMIQNGRLGNLDGRPKFGRSHQPLPPDVAKRAAKMRKLGACLRCRVMKINCSPGETCGSCQGPTLYPATCTRFDLELYIDFFFPAIVNSSYKKPAIDQFYKDNVVSGYQGTMVAVQISSGPAYQPIEVFVHEFKCFDDEFLAIPQIRSGEDRNLTSEFTQQYAPPFSLPSDDTNEELRDKCLKHVELIAQSNRYRGEVYYKCTSLVSWDVFNAILEYQRIANVELVREAIELYAMHFFMTQDLYFTTESADAILASLIRPTKLPYARMLTSNLIMMPIKHVMHQLVYKKTYDVLGALQSLLITPKKPVIKDVWGPAFCTISILCMCTEMIQSSTDLKTVHMMSQEGCSSISRLKMMQQCRERPTYEFIKLFNLVCRTFKPIGIHKNQQGFNPVRDGLNGENRVGLDEPITAFIGAILEIIEVHEQEINDRVGEPSLDYNSDDLSDLLSRHLTFREKNSGKLVSRFLLQFRGGM